MNTKKLSHVWLFTVVFVAVEVLSFGVFAVEPADSTIRAALQDIERYEQQFSGATSANAATVKRTLRLLGLTRDRLDGSTNRGHASWVEADRRLNALVAHLNALASGSGRSSSAAVAAASQQPGQAANAAAGVSSSPGQTQMISQQRVRIKKLIRDIASAADTMDKGGVKPFQSAEYVAGKQAILARFQQALDKYSGFAGDPDVVAAREAVTAFGNMIAFGQQHAAKELATLGNVQEQLAGIAAGVRRVPDPPAYPYPGDSLTDWLVNLAQCRQAAAQNIEKLVIIKERAYLPDQVATVSQGGVYDFKDVASLEAGLRRDIQKVDQSLEQFAANLDLQVGHLEDTFAYVHGLDPLDTQDQIGAFLGLGAADTVRGRLNEAQHVARVAVGFSRQLGRGEKQAQYQQTLDRAKSVIAQFEAKHEQARRNVRVPKAASKSKQLVAIARETLERPDYEVGPIKRLVINADKVHREKKTSEAEFDKIDVSLSGKVTLSGTETTYTYSWDEFQVATVEPVGDMFFIFYNTLKYFTSGGTTTPLNRWILSGRMQGSEIPEANISLD